MINYSLIMLFLPYIWALSDVAFSMVLRVKWRLKTGVSRQHHSSLTNFRTGRTDFYETHTIQRCTRIPIDRLAAMRLRLSDDFGVMWKQGLPQPFCLSPGCFSELGKLSYLIWKRGFRAICIHVTIMMWQWPWASWCWSHWQWGVSSGPRSTLLQGQAKQLTLNCVLEPWRLTRWELEEKVKWKQTKWSDSS